jgi:hypothetical protein
MIGGLAPFNAALGLFRNSRAQLAALHSPLAITASPPMCG